MEISAGIVTGRTVAVNKDGNKAVRLLQVMITDEEDVQTVQLVGQTGEESNPPSSSLVVVLGASEGFKLGIATADGIEPVLGIGGKRIYSTNADGTEVKAEVRLDPDGKVTVSNGGGSFTMSPSGEFTFHGTKSTFDHDVEVTGTVTASVDVVGGGKSLKGHNHQGVHGPTGPPL